MADPADEVTTYPGTTEIALAPMGESRDAKRRGLGDGARGTDSGPSNSTRALELNASLFTKLRAVVLPGTWKSRKIYEQLRTSPVILTLAWLFVPITWHGKLNVWVYGLILQPLYAALPAVFALATFGLMYPAPPMKTSTIALAMVLVIHTALVVGALTTLTGRALRLAAPAGLVVSAAIMIGFLGYHAVQRATVRKPNAPTSAPQPSPIKMLRSSVVSSFRSRPSAASLASHGASSRAPTVTVTSATTHELDWPMLMPFKRLLAAFVVLLLTYYWCQVYTNTVARELNAALGADNNNFGFVTILVFDLSTSAAQRLMSAAATAKAFGKAGVEKSKAEAASVILGYSLALLSRFYERFLFLKFTSLEAVAIAIGQRFLLQLVQGPMTMTFWYFRLRTKVKACLKRNKHVPATRLEFQEYLEEALVSHTFGKVAEFSSLVAWLASLAWLRTGYNSSVYEYDSTAVPLETFFLYIQYAGLFVASEVPLLVLVRFLAMHNGTPFFDASVSRLASGRARLCFIVVAAHVMQDFFVAAVRLEPNTGAG